MNKFIGVGLIGKDPELKTTQSGISVVSFSLALKRKYKNASGEYQTDWVSCVAWRSLAEFIALNFNKGKKIGVAGSIQTRTYEVDGVTKYITEVVVDEAEFVEKKGDTPPTKADDIIPLADEEPLPF